MDVTTTSAIARGDLQALLAKLQHDHFGYDDHGAAALRAFKGLTAAVEAASTFLAITEGGR